MHTREHGGQRTAGGAETDCALCPVARRCWGDVLSSTENVRARRELPLERGAPLLRQGQRGGAVYLVVGGCLILRERLSDGATRVVGLRLPGELVGVEGYATGTQPYTAEAASETTLCRLTLPPRGAGRANAALLERLLCKCAAQVERAAPPWAGLPAVERVAAFLDNYAQRAQAKAGAAERFNLPMTRAEIGSYLGLATETVVRALGQLRGAQRLSVRGRSVCLAENGSQAVPPG